MPEQANVQKLKTPPCDETIGVLERLLQRARDGEVIAMVAAAVNPGGATDHIVVGRIDYRSQALAIMDMQWQLMQRRYANCVTETET
jgi:hypothetical protein